MKALEHAYAVIELAERNAELEYEVNRLRDIEKKYSDLLNDSVRRGQEDVAGWLGLLMSDRIKFEPTK